MKERRSGIPEQGPETFLGKMSVIGENIGQSFPAHDLHRYAVRQTVSFVGPRAAKTVRTDFSSVRRRDNDRAHWHRHGAWFQKPRGERRS
jgi:hypothetical protein